MAPGGRKAANKARGKNQLQLGDLVLAKIKGYPAWPAKVSRPEDWDKSPDPKKHFVEFFGTEEIAFVASADIQVFNDEVKSKLLARCQGKSKNFSVAVEDICKAFDELQRNKAEHPILDNAASSSVAKEGTGTLYAEKSTPDDQSSKIINDIGVTPDELSGHGLERPRSRKDSLLSDSKPAVTADIGISSVSIRERRKAPLRNSRNLKGRSEKSKSNKNANHLKEESSASHRRQESAGVQKSVKPSRMNKEFPKDADNARKLEKGAKTEQPEMNQTSDLGVENLAEPVLESQILENPAVSTIDNEHITRLKNGKNVRKLSNGLEILNCDVKEDKTALNHAFVRKKSPQGTEDHSLDDVGDSRPAKRLKRFVMGDDDIIMPTKSCTTTSFTENKEVNMSKSEVSSIPLKSQSTVLKVHQDEKQAALMPSTKSVVVDLNKKSSVSKDDALTVERLSTVHTRRRARVLDEDEDDEQKTPVHRNTALRSSKLSDSFEKHISQQGSHGISLSQVKKSTSKKPLLVRDEYCKGNISPSKSARESVPAGRGKIVERTEVLVERRHNTGFPSNPNDADHKAHSTGRKSMRPHTKLSTPIDTEEFQGSSKLNSEKGTQVTTVKDAAAPKLENMKNKAKSSMQVSVSAENRSTFNYSPGHKNTELELERLKMVKLEKIANDAMDSTVSMKHLIAAAQAKRKHGPSHSPSNETLILTPQATSRNRFVSVSCPGPLVQDTAEASAYSTKGGFLPEISTPEGGQDILSKTQIELNEHRVSPLKSSNVQLSGGTDACIARDALEGMIETLSRTKESIGRATRLAIDCAKYGIAGEIVELLSHKLESEPSFSRRISLLFLVDSITQCSHSQNGIAGASYIPAVQAALPRLLGAAAPPGDGARENRLQCLKVLRLWLERKIMPENLLRRYMEDINVPNDDTSAEFSIRRPTRAERSVDDPIREMEEMFVDEYGSNENFQLPVLMSSQFFEDDDMHKFFEDEDRPNTIQTIDGGLLQMSVSVSDDQDPTERSSYQLEDVEGELEMEDLSVLPAVVVDMHGAHFQKKDAQVENNAIMGLKLTNQIEPPLVAAEPPPLPLDSPPTPPPLPPSPPPSSPPLPPPLPLSPSPPPPPLPVLPHLPSVSPPPHLVYQSSAEEYYRCPNSNQVVQMNANTFIQGFEHPTFKNDLQQSSNLMANGVGNAPTGSNFVSLPSQYRNNSMLLSTQNSLPNYHYQQPGPSFQQAAFHSLPPQNPRMSTYNAPQSLSNHFSNLNPGGPTHAYDNYTINTFSNIQRQVSSNPSSDDPQKIWLSGGGAPSSTESPLMQDGYVRSNMEKSSSHISRYNVHVQNPLPTISSVPGNVMQQMLPGRSDISAATCWRPA